jgi:hypothetical protein
MSFGGRIRDKPVFSCRFDVLVSSMLFGPSDNLKKNCNYPKLYFVSNNADSSFSFFISESNLC